jgi:hypothetical protein
MSFLKVIHTLGHDLADIGKFIEEALPVAESVLSVVDPPVGAILAGVQAIVNSLTSANKVPSSADLQAIIKAVTVIEAAKQASLLPPANTVSTVVSVTGPQ